MTRPLLEPPVVPSTPPPKNQPSPTTSSGKWWPYSGSKDFASNLALIVIFLVSALVCIISINAAVRFFLRWWKADERPETKVPAAAAASARPPPTMVYSSGAELAGVNSACSICLSEFKDGERVRVLPRCRHGFHVKCIEAWLASHVSCPTCRAEAEPERPLPAA